MSHDKARRHSGCRRARSSRSDIDLVVGAGDCNLLAYFSWARGGESRGSWFGYPIARRVLCRRHVQSLICAWAAVVGHERVYFVVEIRGTSFSCTTSATQNTPK